MLRKDRQITDMAEVLEVLGRCDTVRIALAGDEYPYAVPVSFGFTVLDGETTVYFHSAAAGYKARLLAQNPRVCVEGDIFHGIARGESGITAIYESVIAFGTAQIALGKDKIAGLRAILEHYDVRGYPVENCSSVDKTVVYKVILESITGKRNMPKQARAPFEKLP